jgi:hypothetical protein
MVQFKVFANLVPLEGKRWETIRDMERVANEVEAAIIAGLPTINIATPIAFTPQFGSKTARITIVGTVREDDPLRADRTNATFDHDNAIMSGQIGGPNMARTDPLVDAAVKRLKSLLEGSSSHLLNHIYRIEYAGCVYGEGGRHFPL